MALRPTPLTNADQAVAYFGAELGSSEYYLKQKGVWHGKLVERLGLTAEVTREDFVALMNNERPGTNGKRLTARQNKTRKKTVWKLDEKTQSRVHVEQEVSNRRVAVDWTFSLPKEMSVYLAKTHDPVLESLVHKALIESLDALQAQTQTQVHRKGEDFDRTTGEALFGVFIHRTTRPVDGIPDPHWHAHCVMPNVTWDQVEHRFKAANILFHDKAYRESVFHARLNEMAIAAGYGFRRTSKGLEMSVFERKECRIFCKRTEEIEALERKERTNLQLKASAIVKAAAKKGKVLEHDSVYTKLKDKLGERTRKGKDTAIVDGAALESAWAKQMGPGRWEAITPEAARNGDRIGFLDPERAKELTIEHVFATKAQVRDADLFKDACRYCEGSMAVAEIDAFCRDDPRLVRNPGKPGMVTTVAIAQEEQRIRDIVAAGKGAGEPIAKGMPWEVRDKQLDEGQFAAVKLILESRDMIIAIPGRTGSGKSRTVAEAAHAIKALTGHDPFVLAPQGKQAIALSKAVGGTGAHTIAGFRVHKGLQAQAKGRHIFIDEFSQVGNADMQWLLDYSLGNNSPLVFWGDGKQHQGITRGDPVADLIKANLIEYRQLTKIYRQQDAELLAAVEHSA
jgi:conjugative relaxase-like TrwC/TraI family protein